MYNNNTYIKCIINGTNKCCYNICTIISCNKLEYFDSWYGIIYLENNKYKENIFLKEECDDYYNDLIQSNKIKNENYSMDALFMIKREDKWISKLLLNENMLINTSVKKTKKYFISVEYHHPEITEPIELEINENFYLIDNEILSKVFVLRILEYQSNSYIFDDNYTLKIMDNNVNMFDLNYKNYIILKEDGYKVENINI